MTKEEVIQFWLDSSDKDYETMLHLFESGDFLWSLYIGHLVIEKLLKAYFVQQKDENYPMIHNLLRIAEKAGMDLNDDQQLFFSTVTGFNISARYDDYKQSFYRKCTREFTSDWIEKIKEQREWIKKQLLK
ncbi:MAG: HEPN domain-containing protein [Bacteroidetes bacterium]|nr:HEPN domain-containing protein [Bacteroidota bacterium]